MYKIRKLHGFRKSRTRPTRAIKTRTQGEAESSPNHKLTLAIILNETMHQSQICAIPSRRTHTLERIYKSAARTPPSINPRKALLRKRWDLAVIHVDPSVTSPMAVTREANQTDPIRFRAKLDSALATRYCSIGERHEPTSSKANLRRTATQKIVEEIWRSFFRR